MLDPFLIPMAPMCCLRVPPVSHGVAHIKDRTDLSQVPPRPHGREGPDISAPANNGPARAIAKARRQSARAGKCSHPWPALNGSLLPSPREPPSPTHLSFLAQGPSPVEEEVGSGAHSQPNNGSVPLGPGRRPKVPGVPAAFPQC